MTCEQEHKSVIGVERYYFCHCTKVRSTSSMLADTEDTEDTDEYMRSTKRNHLTAERLFSILRKDKKRHVKKQATRCEDHRGDRKNRLLIFPIPATSRFLAIRSSSARLRCVGDACACVRVHTPPIRTPSPVREDPIKVNR